MTVRKTLVRTGEFASIGFKDLNANVSLLLLDLDAISPPQVGLLRNGMFAFQKVLITAMLAPIHDILILIGRNTNAWEISHRKWGIYNLIQGWIRLGLQS